jgi:hypothetical protein
MGGFRRTIGTATGYGDGATVAVGSIIYEPGNAAITVQCISHFRRSSENVGCAILLVDRDHFTGTS